MGFARTACRPTSASRPAGTPASTWSPVSCCSSWMTTPGCRPRRCSPSWPRGSGPTPPSGWCNRGSSTPRDGRRRAAGRRGCGPATLVAAAPRCRSGRVRLRCVGRRSRTPRAGRPRSGTRMKASSWPGGCGTAAGTFATTAPSRSSTRRSPRPGTRSSTGSRPATGSGWPAGTCRCRSGVAYVLSWVLVGGLRLRSRTALRETVRGYQLGLTQECGTRRPMSWRTIWRMTRAGHPPII